jgi:hypothetical protein
MTERDEEANSEEMKESQVERQGYVIPDRQMAERGMEENSEEKESVEDKKRGKKKAGAEGKRAKWGPVQAERRSTRIQNDGRTSLEKTTTNKKKGDLEEFYLKGNNKKAVKSINSKHLHNLASVVGVVLGNNDIEMERNLVMCVEFNNERVEKDNSSAQRCHGLEVSGFGLNAGDTQEEHKGRGEKGGGGGSRG